MRWYHWSRLEALPSSCSEEVVEVLLLLLLLEEEVNEVVLVAGGALGSPPLIVEGSGVLGCESPALMLLLLPVLFVHF